MSLERPLESLSDDEILRGLADALRQSRRVEADLVAHIAEVDVRRLYAREASPSLFVYCTTTLHLSEAEAYLRIAAARVARKHPVVLAMLADGRLHLSGIEKLASHLTRENEEVLLSRAVHKSKRQIEELLAEWAPRPDVPALVRKLPDRQGCPEQTVRPDRTPGPTVELGPDGVVPRLVPVTAAHVEPLSPARYKVQFTAGAELYEKLERLRALLRHEVPDGDLGQIIEKAVSETLARVEARRFGRANSPGKKPVRTTPVRTNPSSRHIPAAVRRAVHQRDGGRCRFVDPQGRRCPERHRLEYHHRHPFGLGGGPSVENIGLMCPAHNRLMAEIDYGRKAMSRHESARKTRLRPEWVGR